MGNVNQTPKLHNSETAREVKEQESSTSSTLTCEICIEPVALPNRTFKNGNKCAHCMIKYIQAKLDDNISDIKCPALNCDHSLEPLSCRPKICKKVFGKWCDVLSESKVLEFDKVYCPNIGCSVLVINECGGGGDLKRCVCPNCKKPFCFQCKVPWHAGYMCDESPEMRDENDIALGVLSEAKKWMRCPVCRHCIERNEGCSYIRCRCGIEFCYYCGEKMVISHQCNCRVTTFNRRRDVELRPGGLWCFMFSVFIVTLIGVLMFLGLATLGEYTMRQSDMQNKNI